MPIAPLRRAAALVCALACLGWAHTAASHELPQKRKLMVQASPDRLEMMLVWTEPAGPRVDVLVAQHDIDGDGELDEVEAAIAGPKWVGRALSGLTFEVPGERPKTQPPKFRFRAEKGGGLSMAVLLSWELPALDHGQSRRLRVALAGGTEVPTTLEVTGRQGLSAHRLVPKANAPHVGPPVLSPGDQEVFVLQRGEKN